MWRVVVLYALALAAAATGLEWLKYRHFTKAFSNEIYILLLAIGFICLGVWVGRRLTPRPRPADFSPNLAGVRSLGLTGREFEVLQLLASGESVKEMARRLDLSPNTIKTYVAALYEKLEVRRRVHAIEKARSLALIP